MSKKLFILKDGELDYTAKVSESKISLSYSKNESWSSHIQGQKIGSINDDGNGIDVKIGDIDMRLDYSQFCELYTLLELKVKNDTNLMSQAVYLTDNELDFVEKL